MMGLGMMRRLGRVDYYQAGIEASSRGKAGRVIHRFTQIGRRLFKRILRGKAKRRINSHRDTENAEKNGILF